MFPLKDENPTEIVPVVTVALIVVNVAAWLLLQHRRLTRDELSPWERW